ncbi:hypothetical protein HHI36_005404 [Cryptolaemus montrouzieri]|uniref:Uncharacterized protein n=1 Tax=Cryptolaemus montrouzieri TaxID=559131 RepID=A0ABD2NU83_9CUCU
MQKESNASEIPNILSLYDPVVAVARSESCQRNKKKGEKFIKGRANFDNLLFRTMGRKIIIMGNLMRRKLAIVASTTSYQDLMKLKTIETRRYHNLSKIFLTIAYSKEFSL